MPIRVHLSSVVNYKWLRHVILSQHYKVFLEGVSHDRPGSKQCRVQPKVTFAGLLPRPMMNKARPAAHAHSCGKKPAPHNTLPEANTRIDEAIATGSRSVFRQVLMAKSTCDCRADAGMRKPDKRARGW
jgi:hypothetical protein